MMNKLNPAVAAGKRLLGCMVMLPVPALVEVIGHAGFDFVVIDAEHGPMTTETIENLIRAAHLTGMTALVRTVSAAPGGILQVLDAGADGLVVPHVITAADAQAVVNGAYYPPKGRRGLSGAARAANYGFIPVKDYAARSTEAITVLVQIEDREALPNLDAIARVEGVHGLFFGPADMATSLGHLGEQTHPDVIAAADRTVAAAAAVGKFCATVARDIPNARNVRERGFQLPIMSSAGLIASAFRTTSAELAQ